MNLISCYKKLTSDNLTAGGIGQGGGGYWEKEVGENLQGFIARELGGTVFFDPRPHGRDSFDRKPYRPLAGDYDIAYCQLFEIPAHRPATFIYSIISDYIGMTDLLEDFLDEVCPNLMISFQYPLNPPNTLAGFPQLGTLPNLVEQCRRHGCEVVYLPWFNSHNEPETQQERDIAAMCTGKMSGTYPFRDAAWRYLSGFAQVRDDIVVSGNPTGSTFSLSDEDYRRCLHRARYYVSGGIYDIQIPPKYYEVANYGAAIISPDMPMMEASGFIPYETYLPIQSTGELGAIIDSIEDWKHIGPAGRAMVQERHSIERRAKDIAALIHRMI